MSWGARTRPLRADPEKYFTQIFHSKIPTFTFNTLSYNYYKYINTITIPFKYVMRKTLIVYETRLGVPVSHRIYGTCAS